MKTPKFQEFQARQIWTVAQLIAELQKLPQDARLNVTDADLGGYDVSNANYAVITFNPENNTVSFGHLEETAWKAYDKKEITHEEFNAIEESLWGLAADPQINCNYVKLDTSEMDEEQPKLHFLFDDGSKRTLEGKEAVDALAEWDKQ
jgi:hypothetical protein